MKENKIRNQIINTGVPEEFVDQVLNIGELRNVKTGKLILSLGEKCDNFFFVLKGGVIIRYNNPYTYEIRTTSFHLHNYLQFCGDVNSYLSHTEAEIQIQAITNSDIFEIPRDKWIDLVNNNQNFKEYFMNMAIKTLIHETNDKRALISFSAEQMYIYLQKEKPEVIKQVPSTFIAEFMGISRGYLSRLKKKMLIK